MRSWPGPRMWGLANQEPTKGAAARRATRRLPLGEPPLVVTTHAITSFTISHPGPAGVQPRTGAGSSPSYHDRTTRKSARWCAPGRHPYYSNPRVPINRLPPQLRRFFEGRSRGRPSGRGGVEGLDLGEDLAAPRGDPFESRVARAEAVDDRPVVPEHIGAAGVEDR